MDTSKAMRPRASAVQKTVSNLLLSGMHAELQRGDTIGVWTYNEQLYAGRLPLQQWTPEDEQLVATNIVAFLKRQPYEKKSRLDTVWPALQSLVRESEKLTVLLVSDGDENISDTPFDREINEFFKTNSRSQERKRMPFVTVLRSYRGKFISVTLNLAPWPAEFSPFPPEPEVAAKPKPKPPSEKIEPRPTAPPLIVVGKKPEPASVAPTVPSEPTPTKSAAPTNDLPVAVVEPKSPPAPTEAAPTPTALPTEAAPTTPAATIQPNPDALPVTTPPAKPVVEPKPPPVELPKPVPTPVVATPETKPTLPPIASPPVIAPPTEPSYASTPPPVNPKPTPVAPAAHADELKPEPSPALATVKPPPAIPPAQVATATQPEKGFSPKNLVVIGLGLLVLAGAVFFLVQRRARATAHASLITRSMDQDKK